MSVADGSIPTTWGLLLVHERMRSRSVGSSGGSFIEVYVGYVGFGVEYRPLTKSVDVEKKKKKLEVGLRSRR